MVFLIFVAISLLSVFANGQSYSANDVYGQGGSFTSGTANNGGLSSTSLQGSSGVSCDSAENLYVSDTGNHRVLYYVMGSKTATKVFGQADYTSGSANRGGSVAANTLNGPTDAAIDGSGNVYIADKSNHRVLYYVSGSATATAVYGQGGVYTTNTANNGGVSAVSLNNPTAVVLDASGNLYIADNSNHRVLYFASGSTTATKVYGQADYNSNSMNRGGSIAANTLRNPTDVELDGSGGVYIADSGNNRVLYYAAGSVTASRVYGQPDFTSGSSNNGGIGAGTLGVPTGVMIGAGNTVFISDSGNNRVLKYSGASTNANFVYGQGGAFTANTANNPSLGSTSLSTPYHTVRGPISNNLYTVDNGNNRVLMHNNAGGNAGGGGGGGGGGGSGGGTCFHKSTIIEYKGKSFSFEELMAGEEKECVIPHVVHAPGVQLTFQCGTVSTSLRLTNDHLVKTNTGYVAAGHLDAHHTVYYSVDGNKHGVRENGYVPGKDLECKVVGIKTIANVDEYFGLNCFTSVVQANGITTSTFGRYHRIPQAWMKVVGTVFGIKTASSWGDFLASVF